MALEPAQVRVLENVLRAVSTATRSLRLYPPTSPIPRQTVDAAVSALEEYFAGGAPKLELTVAREGFAYQGEPVGTGLVVSVELANTLRDHGVAQIDIARDVTADDLLTWLTIVSRSPESIREEGGIGAVVAQAGVTAVTLTDIQLVSVDQSLVGSMDAETRMREIADNPAKLGDWFAAVATGDPEVFRTGLAEMARAGGDAGVANLASSLSGSLADQTPEGRDALFSLAFEPGPARDITARMFSTMSAAEIASSILDGKFGRNMLSLSSALANLPLDQIADSVRAEVLEMLPGSGHTPAESAFLGHMIEVRQSTEPEPALAETDRTFHTVVQAGTLSETDIERARDATAASTEVLDVVGVRTMLTLLDTHDDQARFFTSVDSLAALVSRLIDRGDLALAAQILGELAARENAHPEWPDAEAHVHAALAGAVDAESAASVVRSVVDNRDLLPLATELLAFVPDDVQTAIAAEGVALKSAGLEVAEALLGRRLVDLLYGLVGQAQRFQLGPLVEVFVADGSARSLQVVESLLSRPDEAARREVVVTLSTLNDPALLPLLGAALRDPSEEVAAIAARAIAKSGQPGSAALLAGRLSELDVDNADFTRARELIGALARTPEPEADEALARLAARRALIKRGRFAEVQQLVAQAIAARAGGAAR